MNAILLFVVGAVVAVGITALIVRDITKKQRVYERQFPAPPPATKAGSTGRSKST